MVNLIPVTPSEKIFGRRAMCPECRHSVGAETLTQGRANIANHMKTRHPKWSSPITFDLLYPEGSEVPVPSLHYSPGKPGRPTSSTA